MIELYKLLAALGINLDQLLDDFSEYEIAIGHRSGMTSTWDQSSYVHDQTLNLGDCMNTLLEKIISTIEKREHWTTSELVAELRSHHEIRATACRMAPDSEVLAPGEHASPPSLRDGFRPEDD